MSVSYHAYVFYGDIFPRESLFSNDKVRACEHKIERLGPNIKFCHECGKPLWIETKQQLFEQACTTYEVGYMDIGNYASDLVVIGICIGHVDQWTPFKIVAEVDNRIKGKLGQFAKEHSIDMSDAKVHVVIAG